MDNIALHAFNGLTGEHIIRLPATSLSWSDSINEEGTLSATIPRDPDVDEDLTYRVYGTIVAAIGWGRVLHAGYLEDADYKEIDKEWEIAAGGGQSIFNKRLVLNYDLIKSGGSWTNGTVTVDEESPSGNWPLTFGGTSSDTPSRWRGNYTYSDIIRGLIMETESVGDLPITPASFVGTTSSNRKTKTYNSYDYATVLDRIEDIGDLEEGPEFRFDPIVDSNDYIHFEQVTSSDGGELIDNYWTWNSIVPDSGVILSDINIDSDNLCSECYGSGGKEQDELLVYRKINSSTQGIRKLGWPILQISNTGHTSVSELSTLQSYVNADVANGDNPQRTRQFYVDLSRYDVHVGDWADVRIGTDNSDVLELKVTDVSGTMSDQMLTVSCRERE